MFFKKIDRSCDLVLGMAERLDCDVTGKLEHDPEVEATAFRAAVLRCAACKEQDACQKLQDANAHLERAPSYCRNTWG